MSFVSIVVPVYHNAPSLPDLLVKFQELAARNPDDGFEFVFIVENEAAESLNIDSAASHYSSVQDHPATRS